MERNSSTRLNVYKYSSELLKETKKSKDPYTQVGCLLLNSDGEIVGRGHNDKPKNWNTEFPWNERELKNKYVIHAEVNAVANCGLINPTVAIVTLFPCTSCAKLLISKGVTTIYYHDIRFNDDASQVMAMCTMCDVELIRF